MRCGSSNVDQELFEVFLRLKCILIEESHFSDGDDFTALLQEDGDANIFGES